MHSLHLYQLLWCSLSKYSHRWAPRGQPRSPSDVVFPFFCLSLCFSLSPSVWKNHLSFSQEIPPRPRGETDREGVKAQQSRSATEGHSRNNLTLFFCLCFFYLFFIFLLCLRVLKQNVNTFPPRCVQDASEVLD